jgi:hypothetical protein
MTHILWVERQNKLEIPKNKDEVNKEDIHDCDGRDHYPDTMVVPLTPKPKWKTETLKPKPKSEAPERSAGPHSFFEVYYESIKREPKIRGINKCRCDERLQTKTKEFTRLPYTGLPQCKQWSRCHDFREGNFFYHMAPTKAWLLETWPLVFGFRFHFWNSSLKERNFAPCYLNYYVETDFKTEFRCHICAHAPNLKLGKL